MKILKLIILAITYCGK